MVKGIIFDWTETLSEGSRKLFPRTKDTLEELHSRGYALGLVSLAGHGIQNRREDILATWVWDYFQIVIVDTVKTLEQYLECMKSLGSIPEDTLVVDDRILRGITLGNTLGCKTVWLRGLKYGNELPTQEIEVPTYTIHSIEEILEII